VEKAECNAGYWWDVEKRLLKYIAMQIFLESNLATCFQNKNVYFFQPSNPPHKLSFILMNPF
jgi:hypothetical protein